MGSSIPTLVGPEGDWLHDLQTWKLSLCLRGRRGSGPEGTVCIWTMGVSGYSYKQITNNFRQGRLPSLMSLHKIPGPWPRRESTRKTEVEFFIAWKCGDLVLKLHIKRRNFKCNNAYTFASVEWELDVLSCRSTHFTQRCVGGYLICIICSTGYMLKVKLTCSVPHVTLLPWHHSRNSHCSLHSGKCASDVWIPQAMRTCNQLELTEFDRHMETALTQSSWPGLPWELVWHFLCNVGHLEKRITCDWYGIQK